MSIIAADDFFNVLAQEGIASGEDEALKRFFCLDAGYQDLLLVKKIQKALDEVDPAAEAELDVYEARQSAVADQIEEESEGAAAQESQSRRAREAE